MTDPGDPLDRVLAAPEPPAFALLYRPEHDRGTVDVLTGELTRPVSLAGLPVGPCTCGAETGAPSCEVLALVPYRQLAERGFAAPDDGEPLLALSVAARRTVPVPELLARLPHLPTPTTGRGFDLGDEAYADTVRRIVTDEIGTGEGANFVVKRTFRAAIRDYTPRHALSLFRELLSREQGTYWTFLVHTGDRTFVGATPERHVSLRAGTAVMNPVSGTYRYPPAGPTLRGVTGFLADRKERDELSMVLDEELKMMARLCENGGRVSGPRLKEMTGLAHTEYLVEGRTDRDVRDILRETLFAPTVTGSPLESAARVISRYEPEGRGYYGGVAALIGHDTGGARTLDSAILIRTADIDAGGRLRIAAGATLVRHSDPLSEAAETRAKLSGLLAALDGTGPTPTAAAPHDGGTARFAHHPEVRAALEHRNTGLAAFWSRDRAPRPLPGLQGLKTLVVDAEDAFTAMLGLQLESLGLKVTIRRFDEPHLGDHDLVVLGPGPGDPRADGDPKIRRLRALADGLLADRRPFVAVCLSHQVLSRRLGLPLVRRAVPHQGVQREIDLFGVRERVGFYNTFTAVGSGDTLRADGVGPVAVSRDPGTGEVHALRGDRFESTQFHAESVLTVDGPRILAGTVERALGHAR
ncbi:anthranilate synthase family protein [Streptomyces sp. NPDC048288]|uniref:anthranilate synthase family protein n=1 Tax=Streptomyces sp. NPDC048288 TaxID=3365529 RepID=UPI003710AE51